MKKWILYVAGLALVLGILGAAYIWFFVYNKAHKDIEASTPDFTLTAEELVKEFDAGDTSTNRKYNDKIIQFSGAFKKIEPADTTVSLVFDFGGSNLITAQVLPKYKNEISSIAPGTSVTLKGLYNGYLAGDDIFGLPGEIKLNKCSPVK
jgi:tRNA_anti-like